MPALRRLLWAVALAAVSAGWTPACAQVAVSISPRYSQVVPGRTLQFAATVTGSGNTAVRWQVDNANGGTASSGSISASGLYTPPAKLPVPAIATITAVSMADPAVSATGAVTLVAQAPAGQTHYVATGGNDAGPGTLDNPWATIQHAANPSYSSQIGI